jgi:hypothetical protein
VKGLAQFKGGVGGGDWEFGPSEALGSIFSTEGWVWVIFWKQEKLGEKNSP